MIPDFDEHGLLPAGVHDCTLEEIGARFCWTEKRQALFAGLLAFVDAEWRPLGLACPLYVGGSFVRTKPLPEDIDLVIDLDCSVSDTQAILLAYRLQATEHARLRAVYNLDVWVRHPALANDLAAFFQYVGDKAAAELHIPCRHSKGILRIAP